MAAELEPIGVEGEDYNVVIKGEKKIIVPIRKSDDEPYNADPQVRAYQMVQEGKIGGPGRGQGRKRKVRAAQVVAEEVRKRANKIVDALDAGLDSESANVRLKAAGMALDIERQEDELQLKEDQAGLDNATKEELLESLIQLVTDPSTEAALEVITLPETAITEVSSRDTRADEAGDARRAGTASDPSPARADARASRGDGRSAAPRGSEKGANPFTAVARRRSAD